jgi:tyrosyl-tRNA synthetase
MLEKVYHSNEKRLHMTTYHSDFLHLAQARGFIHQGTDLEALDELMKKESVTAYLGFDATAASLHVGSLVGIMWLRLLQKTGHKPIVLMGGATSRIGDPTWKDTARKLLNEEDIQTNIQSIAKVFDKYLKLGTSSTDAIMVNNDDWLLQINYLDFLRDYGTHFTINRMMTFDSVKLRLERQSPLTFLEFNYMILQAYDFLHLNRHYNCQLQLGGSDQWGNIINGVELVRRLSHKTAYGLTTPLITTASGSKMGKTAQGAVWLNADMLSAYDYWQFWRNTDDRDVGRYLRLFTELPLEEIAKLEALQGSEINEAKKILADETTKLAHGAERLADIHNTASKLFGGQETGTDSLVNFPLDITELPLSIDELLVKTSLASSKGEARRLVQGKGVRLDDQIVEDAKTAITSVDLAGERSIKLSVGKKKHLWLVLEPV